jgi:hypothetical protein
MEVVMPSPKKKTAPKKTQASKKAPAPKKAPAIKKTPTPRAQAGKSIDEAAELRAELRKELLALIKDLPAPDLKFLVAQSKVLIHNREVEDLENEMAQAEAARGEAGSYGVSALSGANPGQAVPLQIIKSASGNANLVLNGQFKLLTPEELASMAKIAIAEDTRSERLTRLFRWLDRERRDILIDGDMGSRQSPRFLELFDYLEKTFSHRKGQA